jgi:predicted house-cleaning NTP pyrophosphatase (Maf/HAM1 superfamily)
MGDGIRAPRRWVSEDSVLAEMERLNDQSMDYVNDLAILLPERAAAEVAHKVARAKRILVAKHNGVRSIGEAEYIAEADDAVAALWMERLGKDAQAEALREALRSIRTNQDGLRTAAASARDGVTGPGWKGAAHGG